MAMKILKYLLILSVFIPLLLFRDFTPNNELKYLSIVDEAIRDGHFFTLWNHGMVYADKPPLYFWLLMGFKLIFGSHYMLLTGLLSVIPALVILYVMDKWVQNSVPSKLQISGQLLLLTNVLFLGSAVVLRMDMLMCMFIVLALYTFYQLYKGRTTTANRILLPVYIFLALFSKGPVGLIVPVCSILAFLTIKRELRYITRYLNWTGISIFMGLCVIWFGTVYAEGGQSYLNNLLFNQTINRAIDSSQHKEPFYYYLSTIGYSMAPWILLYVITIAIAVKKHLIQTDKEKLFLSIIVTTFVILSVFSSKLDIYLLPIYPFTTYLTLLLLPKIKEKYIYFTIAIPAIILTLTVPALYIIRKQFPISVPLLLYAGVSILTAAAILTLIYLYHKKLPQALNSLCIGLLLTIFISSFAIPKFNEYIGFGKLTETAKEIADQNKINRYCYYRFRSGENMDVYLGKEVQKLDTAAINLLKNKENFILFIKNKDLKREENLVDIIKDRISYSIGDYQFIVFKQ